MSWRRIADSMIAMVAPGSVVPRKAVLVAMPAYNEEATISDVIRRVRGNLLGFDLLVVDDGSLDRTGEILACQQVRTATHYCNLGYGRAVQTAINYALRGGYECLITMDADGQHLPEQVLAMYAAFERDRSDYLVGSRYVQTRDYSQAPFARRLGMQMFSLVTGLATGKRIWDTTSGLKIMRRTVFASLTRWHFVDFHAEAIVYLSRLGFSVGEFPITVEARRHGTSMYSFLSALVYPMKTALMVALATVHAAIERRGKR
jgi:glycosyltransferase involved in cell wall biosynthesis